MNTERSGRRCSGATDRSCRVPASAASRGGSTPSSTAASIAASSVSARDRDRSGIARIMASASRGLGRAEPVPDLKEQSVPARLADQAMELAEGFLYALVGILLVIS